MAPFSCSSATDSDFSHVTRMLVNWQLLCVMCGVWLFYMARCLPAGLFRSMASLPVAAVLLNATPYLLSRCQMPVLFIPQMTAMSISAFKVAAFGIGRGPLAMERCHWYHSLPQFLVVLSLPIIPTAAVNARKALTPPTASNSTASSTSKPERPTRRTTPTSSSPVPLPVPTSPTTVESYMFSLMYQGALIGLAVYVGLQLWLPDIVRHWFYTLCLVLSLQAIWDTYGLIAALFFGIEPARSFHNPWMSSTLAEYWARRWNLPITYMLRVLVYDPVIEWCLVPAPLKAQPGSTPAAAPASKHDATKKGASAQCTLAVSLTASSTSAALEAMKLGSAVHSANATKAQADEHKLTDSCSASSHQANFIASKPSRWLRFAALQTSFAFSGAWHTLIFYYTTGRLIPHWFAFFAVQAPACATEAVVLKIAKKRGIKLPHALAVCLTNFALIAVGSPLFFAPVDWSGLGWAFYDNVVGQLPGSEWKTLCRHPAAVSNDYLTRGKRWVAMQP